MTTRKNNKAWIVYSVIVGFVYGATLYCAMVGSFYEGAAEGFEAGRKKGFEEVHKTIVSAYNGKSQASQRPAAPQ